MKTNSKYLKKEQCSLFNLLVMTFIHSDRCWFGKEPGKYMDYIYQGPVILVLMVRENPYAAVSLPLCPHCIYLESFYTDAASVSNALCELLH